MALLAFPGLMRNALNVSPSGVGRLVLRHRVPAAMALGHRCEHSEECSEDRSIHSVVLESEDQAESEDILLVVKETTTENHTQTRSEQKGYAKITP